MNSPRYDNDALIFSQLAQMKFKPIDCPLLKPAKQQNYLRQPSQLQTLQSNFSPSYSPDQINKELKYLFSLNQSLFLIGNQNQIDLIGINGASQGLLDTQYFWSINLKQPMLEVAIDKKKCFLAFVLDKSIQIFVYNPKKLHQIPKIYKVIGTKKPVRFIQFAKQAHLIIFYDDFFEAYIMEDTGKLIKRCQKSYGVTNDYKIFSVPQAVDSVFNIFFEKQSNQENTFSLWSMKVVLDMIEIKLHSILKVYDIKKSLKKKVQISNFSRDTFFLNIGCEIIAAKKNFIIDSINVNIQNTQSKLIYLSNQKLLHIDQSRFEIYDIKIDTSFKPNRLKTKSIDSLQLYYKPPNSQLIDVINFGKDNFGIFFQLRPQNNNYTNGEIKYWFSMTQFIKKSEKIKKIFNYGTGISNLSPELIEAKCDMARKIGMEEKQIYLEIWNRTSKNSLEDYKFLLATKDFKTIFSQIQKKLKKQSMSFRQLLKIFQSCLDILTKVVYGPQSMCTEQSIQEYLQCHLLVRKLKLFKEIEMYHRNQQSQINVRSQLDNSQTHEGRHMFMITIQDFYEYKNFDIKGYIIDHVNMFCQEKKNTIMKIRLILRAFRFVYRVIYQQLLEDIIVNAKSSLLTLLQAIPEILPYNNSAGEQEEMSLYEGIWSNITQSEWESNLHYEKVRTLQNFEKLNQVINSVWYKRHWLTTHDLIILNKQQILENHKRNVSEEIFYYFISSIFQKIKDNKNLEVLIQFLQNFYESFPQHIKGKAFLYYDLWGYYCKNHGYAKRNKLEFHQFLKLKGQDLFKFYFHLQKVKKNCILRQIKPIYLKVKSQYAGIDIFNHGLLEYFESDLSQISDLKYLLNRMNNQKQQFHGANTQTYEILVQAMQIKLTIGGSNDIPIEQTLIYIENIPLSKDNKIMAQLLIVQRINEQSQRFRKMKLNMSLRDIIDNCEDVISKVIEYEFNKKKIDKIQDISEFKKITYSLLAEVQTLKQKIYGEHMNNLPFFIYISQILENYDQIELASEILHDEYLNRYFTVNETIIENLVLYMYKKRFSKSSLFKNHADYIKKLMSLLPQKNDNRQFILNELEFALQLSVPGESVQFPISEASPFPKVNELMSIVRNLPENFILSVNIEKVYQTMRKMQQIQILNNKKEQDLTEEYLDNQLISQHQVYEIFIVRMIELNMVHAVIPYIKKIIELEFPNKNYNTLYLIILVLKIASELNDDTKHGLISLIAYAFQDQLNLINLLEFYINTKMTSLEKGKIIGIQVQKIVKGKVNYGLNQGLLFKDSFLQEISSQDQKIQLNASFLIKSTWQRVCNIRDQFHEPFYEMIFIILCNQPFMLAKLIYLLLQSINFKLIRSFISCISGQQIFDEMKVLEFFKRVFLLILQSRIQNQEINIKLFSFEKLPLDQQVFLRDYRNLNQGKYLKLAKAIKTFEKKYRILYSLRKNKRQSHLSESESIHIKIYDPQKIAGSQPSEYPFEDFDDNQKSDIDEKSDVQILSPNKHRLRVKTRRSRIIFNEKSQRNKFMNRNGKKLGDYMKQHTQTSIQSQKNISMGKNSFRIKSRIASFSPSKADKQQKLQRAMGLSYSPQNSIIRDKTPQNQKKKKMKLMDIFLPQYAVSGGQQDHLLSPTAKRNTSKRRSSESIVNIQLSKNDQKHPDADLKQKSSYILKEVQNLRGTETTAEMIIEQLFQDYDTEKKQYNLQKLYTRSKLQRQEKQAFAEDLRKIIFTLYQSIQTKTQLKLALIKSIASTFEVAKIDQKILAVYIQIYNLLQRYGLNIKLNKILSVQWLFEQNSIVSLFEKSKQKIVEISTIENLSKLSKVISLALRKNAYEQQVAYIGLSKILNELQNQDVQQVEVNLYLDEINQIITKFSTKMLRQKGQTRFKEINDGPIKNKLIDLILAHLQKKGDKTSANAIRKSLNFSTRENFPSKKNVFSKGT